MRASTPLLLFCAVVAISACAPSGLPRAEGPHRPAVLALKQAAAPGSTPEQRAASYLHAACLASSLQDSPASAAAARATYNKAAVDLTMLLRAARQGTLWNRTLELTCGTATYRLRYAQATSNGEHWNPAYFTSFTPADEVELKTIDRRNRQEGIGGALVGIRKTSPLEPFSPLVGVTVPVTTVLDFKGSDVTLRLINPTVAGKIQVAAAQRGLAADYSAPLAYYPQKSEFVEGIMGALRVSNYMDLTGLYMLEPYDRRAIPLIFVHGLISTPRMWRNVINELQSDPVLRRRYQCGVFAYPTGNPPLYSALRLREELEQFYRLHPDAPDAVLVGHSMGGILSRVQATTVRREHWDLIGKDKASRFFAKVPDGSLIERATCFEANPHIGRTIFICSPHRGSRMAMGSIGDIAMRLIALPADIASSVTSTVGDSIALMTGDTTRLPNSISGLSPGNPTFKVLDARPIMAPHHSIIGDRGKGDTPESTDGVVEYWSSHLKSAQSEKIVPGPHGACELPETIDELRRILGLHLQKRGGP
ncbi:MAG TPA: alpha/beta fold hydrolase [Luteolibacter sp.]|nr:alpha/beta fold hydrolase [Luteolibacter sp.]